MAETDNIAALQKAFFTELSDISVTVYDSAPDDAAYPYVVIDKHQIIEQDNHSSEYDLVISYFSVWSEYEGQKQILDIMREMRTKLHRKKLVLDSGTTIENVVLSRETIRDQDDRTFQGRFRVQSLIKL